VTRLRWNEPSLFEPEQIPFSRLHVRLDYHLDGPRGQLEYWTTICEDTGGWLSCLGGLIVPLMPDGPVLAAELARDAIVSAQRMLSPF